MVHLHMSPWLQRGTRPASELPGAVLFALVGAHPAAHNHAALLILAAELLNRAHHLLPRLRASNFVQAIEQQQHAPGRKLGVHGFGQASTHLAWLKLVGNIAPQVVGAGLLCSFFS